METTRNRQHPIAMSIIYQCLILIESNQEIDIKEIISDTTGEDFDDVDLYIKQVSVSAIAHIDEIKKSYVPNLRKWTWERLALIERAILMLSYSHYYYVGNVDKKVVINVAVELAKEYLDSKDYKFVNAILENTLK